MNNSMVSSCTHGTDGPINSQQLVLGLGTPGLTPGHVCLKMVIDSVTDSSAYETHVSQWVSISWVLLGSGRYCNTSGHMVW